VVQFGDFTSARFVRLLLPVEDFAGRPRMMSAYEMLVLAIAGANGGMLYWAVRRRERVLAWIKVRRR